MSDRVLGGAIVLAGIGLVVFVTFFLPAAFATISDRLGVWMQAEPTNGSMLTIAVIVAYSFRRRDGGGA
ncbi:MAG TPA: hypothetical protein DG761_08310 [Gammaproteobacteria bacterium]|nr:hypothetical protein [Gammaproteobacteria bacterium]